MWVKGEMYYGEHSVDGCVSEGAESAFSNFESVSR